MNPNTPFAAFGRLLIAALFIIGGLWELAEPEATRRVVVAAGVPLASLAGTTAAILEIGGGVLLIVGYRTQLVAFFLAVLCVVAAFAFHHAPGDPNQQIHFLKNIAIAGGLLQLAAFGAGNVSLDAGARAAQPE